MPYFYGSLTSFNCVDVPIAADFTGDSIAEVAVYRRGKKSSFVVNDPAGARVLMFGNATDEPVVGDWDGDGAVNLGIWRPKKAKFRLQTPTGIVKVTLRRGRPTARSRATGTATAPTRSASTAPSAGTFFLRQPDGSSATVVLGDADDLPVTGDWDGNGVTDLGVFDQATATFTLRFVDAAAQVLTAPLQLGVPGDLPVAGDWDGDGITDVGVWTPGHGDLHPGQARLRRRRRRCPRSSPDVRRLADRPRAGRVRPADAVAANGPREALEAARGRGLSASGGEARPTRCGEPSFGLVSENVCTSPSRRSAKATVPGRNTGFLKATSTVTASGRRFSIAAMLRAFVHMPCAICRGNPSALAVSG